MSFYLMDREMAAPEINETKKVSRSVRNARPVSGFGSGGRFVGAFLDATGQVSVVRAAEGLGLTRAQFAETAGLSRDVLYRPSRLSTVKTQTRALEMLEIVGRIVDWAGGEKQALAWYRAEPLPAFGGRTAESLVKDGKAAAVRDWLDHVATGGFA